MLKNKQKKLKSTFSEVESSCGIAEMFLYGSFARQVKYVVLERDSRKRLFWHHFLSVCLHLVTIRCTITTVIIYFQMDSWLKYDVLVQFGLNNRIHDPFFYTCFAILFLFFTFTNGRIYRTTVTSNVWEKIYEISVYNTEVFYAKNAANLKYYLDALWKWKMILWHPMFVYKKSIILYCSLNNCMVFPQIENEKKSLKHRKLKLGPRLCWFWFVSRSARLQIIFKLQLWEFVLFFSKFLFGKLKLNFKKSLTKMIF